MRPVLQSSNDRQELRNSGQRPVARSQTRLPGHTLVIAQPGLQTLRDVQMKSLGHCSSAYMHQPDIEACLDCTQHPLHTLERHLGRCSQAGRACPHRCFLDHTECLLGIPVVHDIPRCRRTLGPVGNQGPVGSPGVRCSAPYRHHKSHCFRSSRCPYRAQGIVRWPYHNTGPPRIRHCLDTRPSRTGPRLYNVGRQGRVGHRHMR